jgi:hypothetical protein
MTLLYVQAQNSKECKKRLQDAIAKREVQINFPSSNQTKPNQVKPKSNKTKQ